MSERAVDHREESPELPPHTSAAAFQDWFGSSKVVDKGGEPLVVYHGTGWDFDSFDPERVGAVFRADSEGFFFTSNTAHDVVRTGDGRKVYEDMYSAGAYAKNAARHSKGGAAVLPVYLKIENPLTVEDLINAYHLNPEDPFDGQHPQDFLDRRKAEIIAMAQEGGHDGIMLRWGSDDTYVVFDPTQIKSQFNRGTYAEDDARILHQGTRTAPAPQSAAQQSAPAVRSVGESTVDDDAPGSVVFRRVYNQLLATGKVDEPLARAGAALHRAFALAVGRHLPELDGPQKAEALYERYQLGFEGPVPAEVPLWHEEGQPVTVYYGSPDGTPPTSEEAGMGGVLFFSTDPATARTFGKHVYAAHIGMANPLVIDAAGGRYGEEVVPAALVSEAMANGHDGIIVRNLRDEASGTPALADTYLVFDPTHVTPAAGRYQRRTLHQFAGERAHTADTAALAEAQQRIAAGQDPEAVRRETGWFEGVDGKWRFEISDHGARWNFGAHKGNPVGPALSARIQELDQSLVLSDVLDHPALFAAYPELANYHVGHRPMPNGNRAEFQRPHGPGAIGYFWLDSALPEIDAASSLLHEVQHAIQRIEGFAPGGSREMFYQEYQRLDAEVGRLNREMTDSLSAGDRDRYHRLMTDRHYVVERLLELEGRDGLVGADQYSRLAGEVEARNTQVRAPLDDAGRQTIPPAETADVPAGEQVVINGEDPSLAADSSEAPAAAFASWFGASKVADGNGQPLVLYHGTGADFESPKKMFWASVDPTLANDYAEMRGLVGSPKAAPNVMPVHMRIEQPLDADRMPSTVTVRSFVDAMVEQAIEGGREPNAGLVNEIKGRLLSGARTEESGPYYSRHDFWLRTSDFFGRDGSEAIRELFEHLAFDGVQMTEHGTLTFGAFEPNQVKSAIGNRGTFDREDARILHQPAFHGTPHQFDRFSLEAVGTGEGAQGFGWGLYFASSREVAKWYQENLSRDAGVAKVAVDGRQVSNPIILNRARHLLFNYDVNNRGLRSVDREELVSSLENDLTAYDASEFGDPRYQAIKAAIQEIERGTNVSIELAHPDGNLYQVDIPEDDQLLDWDKPLREQSEGVREKLSNPDDFFISYWAGKSQENPAYNGADLYERLKGQLGSERAASQYLNSLGIPGLRYLDGDGRGTAGDSYNYVIWDEQAVTIEAVNDQYPPAEESQKERTFNQSAFHGTLHRFDRFSLKAVGNGEGAQSYGWGLYFASERAVAEYYREALAGEELTVNGVTVEPRTDRYTVANLIARHYGGDSAAAYADAEKLPDTAPIKGLLDKYRSEMLGAEIAHRQIGHIYQVDIPDSDELLDWDKPLREQPEGVREKLSNPDDFFVSYWAEKSKENPAYNGADLYERLKGQLGSDRAASQYLNSIGIPGLRYLDAVSRNGEGDSHNYVIWDERRVTVEAVNDELRQAQEASRTLAQPAFHGTPHYFDRFSTSSIGTGEGAQAYGWGLYFAERPGIAAWYRDRLAANFTGRVRTPEGVMAWEEAVERFWRDPDGECGPATMVKLLRAVERRDGTDRLIEMLHGYTLPEMRVAAGAPPEAWDQFSVYVPGRLYEAEIPEDEMLLDWEQTLAEQPATVRDRLGVIVDYLLARNLAAHAIDKLQTGTATGEELYRYLAGEMTIDHGVSLEEGQKLASEALGIEGIPGLRYLDGTSRHLNEDAAATRNFVIWDETLLAIAAVDGKRTNELAPSGEVDAVPVTETAAFKNWFEGSKVVDDEGAPLVVYHGMKGDLDGGAFDPGRVGETFAADERGFFFISVPSIASGYASSDDLGLPAEGGSVIPAYIALRRPLIVDDEFLAAEGMERIGPTEDVISFWDNYQGLILEWMDGHGSDGAILVDRENTVDGKPVRMVVALKPEQIKSVFNRGTFSSDDPRILEQAPHEHGSAQSKAEAPAFRQWFGDSKVVDEDGEPLIVYHGSKTGAIEAFDTSGNGEEVGAFFASHPEAANEYAGDARAEGGTVYPVYLSIQNPYEVTNEQWVRAEGLSPEEAREKGYDGYIVREMGRGADRSDTFIVFRPEQVKSAAGNPGTFTPTDARILNQAAEAVHGAEGTSETPVTDTPAFRRWFGASKITDAHGDPLVVYHGTPNASMDIAERYRRVRRIADRLLQPKIEAFRAGYREWRPSATVSLEAREDVERLMEFFEGDLSSAGEAAPVGLQVLADDVIQSNPFDVLDSNRQHLSEDEIHLLDEGTFTVFDTERAGSNTKAADARAGVFFTDDPEFAHRFTYIVEADPLLGTVEYRDGLNPQVLSVFLKMERPLDLTRISGTDFADLAEADLLPPGIDALADFRSATRGADGSKLIQKFYAAKKDQLEAAGFDGIINKVRYKGKVRKEFVAFRPEQIKSATSNRGTFDPADARILNQNVAPARGAMRESEGPVTETHAFRRWFDGSKVVDSQGNPLVMYHGSDAEIDAFWTDGIGAHFGTREQAEGVAEEFVEENFSGVMYPVYLNIRNPIRLEDMGAWQGRAVVAMVNRIAGTNLWPSAGEHDIRRALEAQGYDGVIYENRFEGDEYADSYIAFRPEQIKSAIGNRGTFDPAEARILNQSAAPGGAGRGTVRESELPVTETPAFRRWFGASKMVSSDGQPRMFYHGTASDFEAFDPRKALDKEGRRLEMGWGKSKFYFASEGGAASSSAEYAQLTGRGETPNVIPVYLRIENPIEAEEYMRRVEQEIAAGSSRDAAIAAVDRAVKREGFDGIVNEEVGGFAVFDPEQIKSVFNAGEFNPADPRILKQPGYHGTPHRFDRFRLDAIGNGEGNQAYGWGLYFASEKSVAAFYQTAVSKRYVDTAEGEMTAIAFADRIVELAQTADPSVDNLLRSIASRVVDDIFGDGKDYGEVAEAMRFSRYAHMYGFLPDAIEALAPRPAEGGVYQVAVPENDELLDWDAPSSESEMIRLYDAMNIDGRLANFAIAFQDRWYEDNEAGVEAWTGQDFYVELSRELGGDRYASQYLASIGVPGLRYLDQGSRGQGQGTYNFVIWDEAAIAIEGVEQQRGGANPVRAGTRALNQPASHGSAALFDRFSLEAVGTGTGVQQLGWGLYFTDDRSLAEVYRDTLLPPQGVHTYADPVERASAALKAAGGDREHAIRRLDSMVPVDGPVATAAADYLREGGAPVPLSAAGAIYDVEIPDDEVLLNADRPLSAQGEQAQEAFHALWLEMAGVLRRTQPELYRAWAEGLDRDAEGSYFYQVLSYALGGEQEASQALNRSGVPGMVLASETRRTFVIWDEQVITIEAINGEPMLMNGPAPTPSRGGRDRRRAAQRSSKGTEEPRGTITMPRDLTAAASIIRLHEAADASTVVHESAHFFWEVALDMARQPYAPAQLKEDVNTVLNWLGVKSLDAYDRLPDGRQEELHEQFATAFERYVAEGRPPGHELAETFEQLADMVLEVYRDLDNIAPAMPQDVREALGRLIAVNDEEFYPGGVSRFAEENDAVAGRGGAITPAAVGR